MDVDVAEQAAQAYKAWCKRHFNSPDGIATIPEEAFMAGYKAGWEQRDDDWGSTL